MRETRMVYPVFPGETNHYGTLFGGTVLAWMDQAARSPLQPGLTVAVAEYAARQARTKPGWATVPPAPPPEVNVPGHPSLPHDG